MLSQQCEWGGGHSPVLHWNSQTAEQPETGFQLFQSVSAAGGVAPGNTGTTGS